MGVSADKAETQLRFIERFGLTFPMVPNPEKDIIRAYGALKVTGVTAQRSTFIVGPDGRIAAVWPKVKLEGHAEEVVETIRTLAGTR